MKCEKHLLLLPCVILLVAVNAFGQLIESQRLKKVDSVNPKLLSDKGDDEEKEFGAVPALTAVLGTREIIPNITLIGAKNFEGKKWYGAIRVFTGATSASDSKKETVSSTLFVNEASSFGFTSVFSRRLIPSQKLGFNIGLNYLGKSLHPDTIHTVSTSVFQGKVGLELVPVQKMLSVYVNLNGLAVADNIASFKEYYANEKTFKFFIDYGVKLYLDTVPASGMSLIIDLNFIAQNGDIKGITKNDDLVIPVLKVGLKKSL